MRSNPALLSCGEAADRLGVSRRTAYKWVQAGLLPNAAIAPEPLSQARIPAASVEALKPLLDLSRSKPAQHLLKTRRVSVEGG